MTTTVDGGRSTAPGARVARVLLFAALLRARCTMVAHGEELRRNSLRWLPMMVRPVSGPSPAGWLPDSPPAAAAAITMEPAWLALELRLGAYDVRHLESDRSPATGSLSSPSDWAAALGEMLGVRAYPPRSPRICDISEPRRLPVAPRW
uniref:Putative secreted protein n=1 Tax=Anopheles darlingi TaxID=43151 RepID=A0A2M4D7D0_ANODA